MSSNPHAFSHPEISFLTQAKLQAQVVVPILRALREKIGKAEADALVANALRDWSKEQFRRVGEDAGGRKLENWQPIWENAFSKIGDGFEMDMLANEGGAQDFNVTKCPYAEFFQELGEPELGAVLLCEQDVHLAEGVGGDDIDFERSQTIMGGASYCDFRIRMKHGDG